MWPPVAVAMLTVAACGGDATASSTTSTVQASPPATAQLTFTASTYAPGDPCASVATLSGPGLLPNDCLREWSAIDAQVYPGQDLMQTGPIPRQVTYSTDIPQAQASATAVAFYRSQRFLDFGWSEGQYTIVAALESRSARDPIADAMAHGGFPHLLPCTYPTKIGLVQMTPEEVAAVDSSGASGTIGVVLRYPACNGVPITMTDGSIVYADEHPAAVSIIETGGIRSLGPFGQTWVTTGEATCGPSLSRACSVVG